jgi:tripartite-type tricarboxylate transporter receptor subunit TctC
MTITRRSILGSTLAAPALSLLPSYAGAQEVYPARELKAPCGFPPGSANDVIVRYYADQLTKVCGKPVVVENRPGAFGNIATEAAARARPDGYTVYISGSAAFAAAPYVFKKLSYDPLKDFEYVGTIGVLAFSLLVDPKLPIHSVADLTAYLRKKESEGKQVAYASAALPSLVASELYVRSIGVKAATVNYRTTADSLNDLYSGSIDFTFASASFGVGQVSNGKLRALAITAPARMSAIPDWPTMIEAGIPGYNLYETWLISLPTGTPRPVFEKMRGWVNQIAGSDDARKFLQNIGMDPLVTSPDKTREMIVRHHGEWKEYAAIAKVEPM